MVTRGGVQRQVLESPLGSSLAVRDASGAQVGMTDHDAFGQELYATGTDRGGSLRFAGGHSYQTDDGTGMPMVGNGGGDVPGAVRSEAGLGLSALAIFGLPNHGCRGHEPSLSTRATRRGGSESTQASDPS